MRLAIAAALVCCFGIGCGNTCETADSDEYVRYNGGNAIGGGTQYESSSWDGEWLYFPPGRRFVLVHNLGFVPTTVHTYLSFSARQDDPDAGINRTEGSGNQVIIETVDQEIVQVRNDTCAEFYLRVVASNGASAADAGTD